MDIVDCYLSEIEAAIRAISRRDVRAAVDLLEDVWRRDASVYIVGNGGSAATASHMMNDLCKCAKVEGQRGVRAFALTDNVPLLTAVGNDEAYERVFMRQLECFLRPGDALVAISGSGNSPNILAACEYAQAQGATVLGLCGTPGGELARRADLRVMIPADHIGQQEDGHLVVNHVLALALRERIENAARAKNAVVA